MNAKLEGELLNSDDFHILEEASGVIRPEEPTGTALLSWMRSGTRLSQDRSIAEPSCEDAAPGRRDERSRVEASLKALRAGNTLAVRKPDRLGCDSRQPIDLIEDITKRLIGPQVVSGEVTSTDSTTTNGRVMFAIFAGLAEFERDLIAERTNDSMQATPARGLHGGRPSLPARRVRGPRRHTPRLNARLERDAAGAVHSVGGDTPW